MHRGKRILILVFTHTPMCVIALYTQYFPESCEKISQACYSGGIRTHNPCISRAVSYQLDIGFKLPLATGQPWESTEYTVLTHIGVWVKTKINKNKLFCYTTVIGCIFIGPNNNNNNNNNNRIITKTCNVHISTLQGVQGAVNPKTN